MCVFEVTLIAAVVFKRGTDIPSNFAVGGERSALVGSEMSNNACAERGDGCFVKIELAIEGGVSGKGGVNARRSEQVECKNRLR